MHWILLALAIAFEVVGTNCMKLSQGFTKPLFGAGMFVCYIICFTLFAFALKKIDLSVGYAIWAGIGTALIAITGSIFFHEPVSALKVGGIALIIVGVVMLNLSGGH